MSFCEQAEKATKGKRKIHTHTTIRSAFPRRVSIMRADVIYMCKGRHGIVQRHRGLQFIIAAEWTNCLNYCWAQFDKDRCRTRWTKVGTFRNNASLINKYFGGVGALCGKSADFNPANCDRAVEFI